jgi:hypothetical protein
MLYFAMCILVISVSKGEVPLEDVDAVLLSQVEDTFGECIGIVRALLEFDEDVFENRRRVDGAAIDSASTLKACAAMAKVVDTFHRDYFAWSRSVLGALQSSEILFLKNLLEDVGKEIGETLFIASMDGDDASEFHSLCDDQGPTLVVVETRSGLIFGGYADVSWSSDVGYVTSSTAFLFQIRPAMLSFGLDMPQHGFYHRSDYGPTFGGGHDLHISSGAMNNTGSYSNQHGYAMSSNNQLNNGERHFQVKDYVVLKAASL